MSTRRHGSVDDWPRPEYRSTALAINEAALLVDGVPPYDEHTLLSLKPEHNDPNRERHMVTGAGPGAGAGAGDVGYAHLDIALPGEPASAELAIHPQWRWRGHGEALLEVLKHVHRETRPGREPLQIWSHGDQPGAHVLATKLGFVIVRILLQLRRSLDDEPPALALPPGVLVRPFRPGQDDAAWLALNAAAFVDHPEQGRMTQADLDARIAEAWFDPDGFLIAEQDGVMIGYHWTKIHPADADPGGQRLGEVYVLGVDPARHGGGLGKALTQAGLRYLFAQGLRTVLLYVESDNEPALAVYHRLEFELWRTDVMYRSAEQ